MKKIIPLLFLLIVVFISSGQTAEQQSLIPVLEKWLPNKPLESLLSYLQIPYWGILVSIEERGILSIRRVFDSQRHAFLLFWNNSTCYLRCFAEIQLSVYLLLLSSQCLFAVADEFHQSFTSGRTASAQDVILDTAGAITALLLMKCIQVIKQRRSAKV